MEELEFLDSAMSNPGGPASSSMDVSTPIPVRRLSTDDSIMVSPGLRQSCPSDAGSRESGSKQKEACLGCGRFYMVSKAFANAMELLRWGLPEGRGRWCTDCFITWRTCHGQTMSLTLFPQWLSDQTNLERWRMEVAVAVTLRDEGVMTITAQMISNRIDFYCSVCRLLVTPTHHRAVVRIEDIAAKGNEFSGTILEQSNLVSLLNPNGTAQVCAFVRPPAAPKFAVELHRHNVFPCYATVACGGEREAALVREVLGGGEEAIVELRATSTALVPYRSGGQLQTKLDGKFYVVVGIAKTALEAFTKKGWEHTAKEVLFTPPASKAIALESEAHTAGDIGVLAKVQPCSQALVAAKAALKALRELSRSRDKTSRFAAMSKNTNAVDGYGRKIGLRWSPSFDMLVLKCNFFATAGSVDNEKGFVPALSDALLKSSDPKLANILADHAADEKSVSNAFSPTLWITNMVKAALEVLFTGLIPEWHPDVAPVLVKDFGKLVDALTVIGEELVREEVGDPGCDTVSMLIADVSAFLTIMESVSDDCVTTPSAIKEAHQRIRHVGLAGAAEAFIGSSTGASFVEKSSVHLARSANEELGDARLATAKSFIADSRVPIVAACAEEGRFMVTNKDSVVNMLPFSVVCESISTVCEAVVVWSPLRLEECIGQLGSWSSDVLGVLKAFDTGLLLVQLEWLDAFAEVDGGLEGKDAEFEDIPALFAALRPMLSKAKQIMPKEEPDLRELGTALENLQGVIHERLPSVADAMHGVIDFVQRIANVNSTVRRNAGLLCAALDELACMTMPSNLQQALDEFKIVTIRRRQSSSFFSVALRLLDIRAGLQKFTVQLGGFDEVGAYCIVQGDGTSDSTRGYVDASRVASAVKDFGSLPQLIALESVVASSIQTCLDEVHAMAYVSQIRFPPSSDGDLVVPCDMLRALVDVGAFKSKGVFDGVMQNYFQIVSESEECSSTSPCSAFRKLTERILDMFGEKKLMALVDCSAFFEPKAVVSLDALKHVMKIMCEVCEIAMLIAVLSKTYIEDLQTVVQPPAFLKDDVKRVMSAIHDRQTELKEYIVQPSVVASTAEMKPARSLINSWVDTSIKICDKYKHVAMEHVATQIGVLSKQVKKCTPTYGHMVSDTIWIKGRCKRELLEQWDRAALAKYTGQLHQTIAAASAAYDAFLPVGPKFEQAFECIQLANGIFQVAREAIILLAHLHVCQELKGEAQLAEAEKLFAKQANVPKTVQECIAGLNAKATALKETATPPPIKKRRLSKTPAV